MLPAYLFNLSGLVLGFILWFHPPSDAQENLCIKELASWLSFGAGTRPPRLWSFPCQHRTVFCNPKPSFWCPPGYHSSSMCSLLLTCFPAHQDSTDWDFQLLPASSMPLDSDASLCLTPQHRSPSQVSSYFFQRITMAFLRQGGIIPAAEVINSRILWVGGLCLKRFSGGKNALDAWGGIFYLRRQI